MAEKKREFCTFVVEVLTPESVGQVVSPQPLDGVSLGDVRRVMHVELPLQSDVSCSDKETDWVKKSQSMLRRIVWLDATVHGRFWESRTCNLPELSRQKPVRALTY